MRLLLAFLLMSTPALAGAWDSYVNSRFGLRIDVPPGWQAQPDSENGDGRSWTSADGDSSLLAWGANVLDGFADDVQSRRGTDQEIGWIITYERGAMGGSAPWFVYSGTLDDRVMYQKALGTCHGEQAIYFRIEYPAAQIDAMKPIVERLSASLKPGVALDCQSG